LAPRSQDNQTRPGAIVPPGLGLRRPHYEHILANWPAVGWFEAISENFMGTASGRGGPAIRTLEAVRERYPVALHGVSLSLGSVDPLDLAYLGSLRDLVNRIDPIHVSDHVCWTGIDGENLHDLLPLPHTEAAVAHFAARVRQVQEFLGRRILIENLSSYLEFTLSEMTEWDFVATIAESADCFILLDVNNIYVSACNHGYDPRAYLEGIPAARVKEIHLAGFTRRDKCLLDTHAEPVHEPVWDLYGQAVQRFGAVPTLLEWDELIPEFNVLEGELARAKTVQERFLSGHESVADRAVAR
jgi:uncharacterized protein (UPF0276 family)